jgi:hypothetical protein
VPAVCLKNPWNATEKIILQSFGSFRSMHENFCQRIVTWQLGCACAGALAGEVTSPPVKHWRSIGAVAWREIWIRSALAAVRRPVVTGVADALGTYFPSELSTIQSWSRDDDEIKRFPDCQLPTYWEIVPSEIIHKTSVLTNNRSVCKFNNVVVGIVSIT